MGRFVDHRRGMHLCTRERRLGLRTRGLGDRYGLGMGLHLGSELCGRLDRPPLHGMCLPQSRMLGGNLAQLGELLGREVLGTLLGDLRLRRACLALLRRAERRARRLELLFERGDHSELLELGVWRGLRGCAEAEAELHGWRRRLIGCGGLGCGGSGRAVSSAGPRGGLRGRCGHDARRGSLGKPSLLLLELGRGHRETRLGTAALLLLMPVAHLALKQLRVARDQLVLNGLWYSACEDEGGGARGSAGAAAAFVSGVAGGRVDGVDCRLAGGAAFTVPFMGLLVGLPPGATAGLGFGWAARRAKWATSAGGLAFTLASPRLLPSAAGSAGAGTSAEGAATGTRFGLLSLPAAAVPKA
eukprot:jgi/Chrpa1/24117/Chrysochromulina_OHIO_Genome00000921-RA